ncbi:hypothetical protein QT711_06615 [Sporosarcina saromensis]|uniref:Uncharacterized protein n=1 Tax=Sporosarcina saromensis TaxID=359365 RepID=A0ABU4GB81_9BACL|nr:hypothetical protein [Sporosarcina saromensis]MDW0112852.1 hypothetical protein [Sporosarcina saromensis]
MKENETNKYPQNVVEAVAKVLELEVNEQQGAIGTITKIDDMPKVNIMDMYVSTFKFPIDGKQICQCVKEVFGIQIDSKYVLPKKRDLRADYVCGFNVRLIDNYLKELQNQLTGQEIRLLINDIFGINLDAIDSLEKTQISLYSKGQWIVQQASDLFVVHTGIGDIDAWVLPTDYYIEQTGLKELPVQLQQNLASIGYEYNSDIQGMYYCNPTGEAVEDAFKGRTMRAILSCID